MQLQVGAMREACVCASKVDQLCNVCVYIQWTPAQAKGALYTHTLQEWTNYATCVYRVDQLCNVRVPLACTGGGEVIGLRPRVWYRRGCI